MYGSGPPYITTFLCVQGTGIPQMYVTLTVCNWFIRTFTNESVLN